MNGRIKCFTVQLKGLAASTARKHFLRSCHTLGHKDISTTLNIYTDVTKELRRSEFEGLDSYFKNEYNKAANI